MEYWSVADVPFRMKSCLFSRWIPAVPLPLHLGRFAVISPNFFSSLVYSNIRISAASSVFVSPTNLPVIPSFSTTPIPSNPVEACKWCWRTVWILSFYFNGSDLERNGCSSLRIIRTHSLPIPHPEVSKPSFSDASAPPAPRLWCEVSQLSRNTQFHLLLLLFLCFPF